MALAASVSFTNRDNAWAATMARVIHLDAHVLSHQSGLLMLEDVAMIHERVVARCGTIESDEELRAVLDKHHVLPAGEMSGRRAPAMDKMRNNAPWI